ncbi:RecF/RecN/SMC N terminal domain-containing protein [Pavlovales sp. CCMP2436]|nr:RecF/RecN/SMC N terminal domain-containing protein [Pavlovales sp. CCMP2436]
MESPGSAPAEGAPLSRLIIHKMVLENFKSYAGAQEIGPFEKCFSAVVGPNGSGKSNVIDAMLFVFGKRAKQMRQAKVADLIHCSEQFPELPFARVVVHFVDIYDREGSEYDVVPGSELEVSRVAYSDSSSKYFVNGRPSSFSEVVVLCKARGVDLDHNRFLILQGEVEQIAMMKPKAPSPHEDGLLEYLEDLIGSNRHTEPSP